MRRIKRNRIMRPIRTDLFLAALSGFLIHLSRFLSCCFPMAPVCQESSGKEPARRKPDGENSSAESAESESKQSNSLCTDRRSFSSRHSIRFHLENRWFHLRWQISLCAMGGNSPLSSQRL